MGDIGSQQERQSMKTIFLTTLLTISFGAWSQIVCENEQIDAKVSINARRKIAKTNIQGSRKRHKILSNSWDGHDTGTITGSSFQLTFQNHYGCIRTAKLEISDTVYEFTNCSGGGTPDEICFPSQD